MKNLKKSRTLEVDMDNFINAQLYPFHKLDVDNNGTVRIPGLGIDSPPIYKTTKFTCKALKGKGSRSGIRVIHAYFKDEDRVELIEIYHKADEENENTERIMEYYGS